MSDNEEKEKPKPPPVYWETTEEEETEEIEIIYERIASESDSGSQHPNEKTYFNSSYASTKYQDLPHPGPTPSSSGPSGPDKPARSQKEKVPKRTDQSPNRPTKPSTETHQRFSQTFPASFQRSTRGGSPPQSPPRVSSSKRPSRGGSPSQSPPRISSTRDDRSSRGGSPSTSRGGSPSQSTSRGGSPPRMSSVRRTSKGGSPSTSKRGSPSTSKRGSPSQSPPRISISSISGGASQSQIPGSKSRVSPDHPSRSGSGPSPSTTRSSVQDTSRRGSEPIRIRSPSKIEPSVHTMYKGPDPSGPSVSDIGPEVSPSFPRKNKSPVGSTQRIRRPSWSPDRRRPANRNSPDRVASLSSIDRGSPPPVLTRASQIQSGRSPTHVASLGSIHYRDLSPPPPRIDDLRSFAYDSVVARMGSETKGPDFAYDSVAAKISETKGPEHISVSRSRERKVTKSTTNKQSKQTASSPKSRTVTSELRDQSPPDRSPGSSPDTSSGERKRQENARKSSISRKSSGGSRKSKSDRATPTSRSSPKVPSHHTKSSPRSRKSASKRQSTYSPTEPRESSTSRRIEYASKLKGRGLSPEPSHHKSRRGSNVTESDTEPRESSTSRRLEYSERVREQHRDLSPRSPRSRKNANQYDHEPQESSTSRRLEYGSRLREQNRDHSPQPTDRDRRRKSASKPESDHSSPESVRDSSTRLESSSRNLREQERLESSSRNLREQDRLDSAPRLRDHDRLDSAPRLREHDRLDSAPRLRELDRLNQSSKSSRIHEQPNKFPLDSSNAGSNFSLSDVEMMEIERKLDNWLTDLKGNILVELSILRMKLGRKSQQDFIEGTQRYAEEMVALKKKLMEFKEKVSELNGALKHKDKVIENLTKALRSEKDKVDMSRSFTALRQEKDEKLLDHCLSKIASGHHETKLKKKSLSNLKAAVQNTWKDRMQKSFHEDTTRKVEEVKETCDAQVKELQQELQRSRIEVSKLQLQQSDWELNMKQALMRGVCALNVETLGVLGQRGDSKLLVQSDWSESRPPSSGAGGNPDRPFSTMTHVTDRPGTASFNGLCPSLTGTHVTDRPVTGLNGMVPPQNSSSSLLIESTVIRSPNQSPQHGTDFGQSKMGTETTGSKDNLSMNSLYNNPPSSNSFNVQKSSSQQLINPSIQRVQNSGIHKSLEPVISSIIVHNNISKQTMGCYTANMFPAKGKSPTHSSSQLTLPKNSTTSNNSSSNK